MDESAYSLLDAGFLAKLRQLQLVSKRVFAGRMKGDRRAKSRGTSVEFADYRNYVAGDEPRFVDWNSYGRLERLFLKLFVEEEDLFVYFLLDTSKSMDFGAPATKLLYAKRLAAALAYISLLGMDRVSIAGFGTGLRYALAPKRGKSQALEIMRFLQSMEPEGATSLEEAARRFALSMRRSGLVVLLSDFLDKAGYERALKHLLSKRCEVYAIHVLSGEELAPSLAGDLRLVDAEDGSVAEVTITERLLAGYRETLREYCQGLRGFCLQRGIGYIPAPTTTPFEELVLNYLKLSGLVR